MRKIPRPASAACASLLKGFCGSCCAMARPTGKAIQKQRGFTESRIQFRKPRVKRRGGYIGLVGQHWRKLALAGAFILAIAGTFVFGYRAGTHARRIRSASDPI